MLYKKEDCLKLSRHGIHYFASVLELEILHPTVLYFDYKGQTDP